MASIAALVVVKMVHGGLELDVRVVVISRRVGCWEDVCRSGGSSSEVLVARSPISVYW